MSHPNILQFFAALLAIVSLVLSLNIPAQGLPKNKHKRKIKAEKYLKK